MKLTKKLEAEVKQVMDTYWDSYLKGDFKKWASFLPAGYRNIGTTQEEIWDSKKAMVDYTNKVAHQLTGVAEMRYKKVEVIPYDPYIMVHELGDMYIKTEKAWTFYAKLRLSSLREKKTTGWKILHQHGSYPDSKTEEGETFAFDKIAKENLELKEAVKRRTAELEHKNRELEIETPLERVRTVAMSMHKPDDLLNICKIFFEELVRLGFKNIRNALIHIFNDEQGYYFDYDYSDVTGGKITHLPYKGNAAMEKFLEHIRQSDDAFAEVVFTGKNMKEWKKFRKKSGQIDDKRLDAATQLNYYFYSIGAGNIGLSNFGNIESQQLEILKRFRNVFDFSYRRYMDIQTAEAQAYEARIEASLERVRGVAMSMNKADDMLKVCRMISAQLQQLGFKEIRNVQTAIIYEQTHEYLNYQYFTLYDKDSIERIDYRLHPEVLKFSEVMLQSPDAYYTKVFEREELNLWRQYRKQTAQLPDPRLDEISSSHYYFYSIGPGALGVTTYAALSEEQIHLFKRFRNVFQLAYHRFTDIEKAEAQAREAQIELALERVRARTMAMQQSSEFPEAANVLFQQMQALGKPAWSAGYCIWDDDKNGITLWMSSEGVMQPSFHAPLTKDPSFIHMREAHERGETFHVEAVGGKELVTHYKYMRTLPVVGEVLDSIIEAGHPLPTFQIFHCVYFSQGFLLFITYELVIEAHEIFKRFGKVFEQTYTRFLDLQKAEAQTRAAQIELAVERVRAKALAMHSSTQILDVVATLRNEMLGLEISGVVAATIYLQEEDDYIRMWDLSSVLEMKDGFQVALDVKFKLQETNPGLYMRRVWNNAANYFVEKQEAADMAITLDWLRQYYPGQADEARQFFNTTEWKYLLHPTIQLAHGKMSVDILDVQPPAEMESILIKMGAAFDLAYKRFLDLQKSEKQIREGQIELALERVRARTMAMQRSDELADASFLLDSQVRALGIKTWGCAFNIYGENESTEWFSSEAGTMPAYKTPRENIFVRYYEAGQAGEAIHIEEFTGDACVAHYNYLCTVPVVGDALKEVIASGGSFPTRQIDHATFFKYGYLLFITFEPVPDAHTIFIRFAKVFEQTYTRFLDLQKAEAQAKEAQIEAALERVRSRTMGMQKSEELKDIIRVVHEQILHLNILVEHAGFIMDYKARDDMHIWLADKHDIPTEITFPYFDSPHWNSFIEAKEKGQDFFANLLSFEEKNRFYEGLFKLFPGIPHEAKEYYFNAPGLAISTVLLDNVGLYIENFKGVPYSSEENNTLMRFGIVFQQTYTRFLDLQKAEAQVREAQVEAALERVRSRSLAMHKTSELQEVIHTVHRELLNLNIAIHGGSFITINSDIQATLRCWGSGGTADTSNEVHLPLYEKPFYTNLINGLKNGPGFFTEEFTQQDKKEFFTFLLKHEPWSKLDAKQKKETLSNPGGYTRSCCVSQHSSIFIINHFGKKFSEDDNDILKRFGKVFEQAYTRFLDLQKAEAQAAQAEQDLLEIKAARENAEEALSQLRATQAQLVQREKMASLGELTAGIAHEIQNPLNFVNNFSEISSELVDDMIGELANGNVDHAKAIGADVKQNLEKITHHGKRAESIVKGMLQHSRASSGQKELTDINALVDEYLKLAYHGVKAKDNTVNAELQTDYDVTIGSISIIPQDIGRVLLNLLTNAFYAIGEKRKQVSENYGPKVSISTRKADGKIKITVADNGTGIPPANVDKIFQPFFTTKPTGQGTGLGLSLAYGIVKAHGGELMVDTVEGSGSAFIIRLNVNS